MFDPSEIEIHIDDVDYHTVLLRIVLPIGTVDIVGTIEFAGTELRILGAHIGGLHRGAINRSGLNSIGRKILEDLNVERLYIEGAARTTGRNPGRPPKPFRYPR